MMRISFLSTGFALIEVLVAWFLVMLVGLGVASFEVKQLQMSRDRYHYNLAVIQLQSMAERLRVYHNYRLRLQALHAWNKENRQLLPHSVGVYYCHVHHCEVSISWKEKNQQKLSLVVDLP